MRTRPSPATSGSTAGRRGPARGQGAEEPLVLQVGAKSPTGVWVYAREGGKPAVLTVSELVRRDTTRPARGLPRQDRPRVRPEERDRPRPRDRRRPDLAQADEPRKWQIAKPRALPRRPRHRLRLPGEARSATSRSSWPSRPRRSAARPRSSATVTISTGQDKDRATKTLLFGRADPAKKGVYAMRAGEPGVMLVPEELWTAFPKTVAALRDKTVLAYAQTRPTGSRSRAPRAGRHRAGRTVEDHGARGAGRRQRSGERCSGAPRPAAPAFWAMRPRVSPLSGQARSRSRSPKKAAKAPKTAARALAREARWPARRRRGGGGSGAAGARRRQGARGSGAKSEWIFAIESLLPVFEPSDVKRARSPRGQDRWSWSEAGRATGRWWSPRGAPPRATRSTNLLYARALRWKEIVSPQGDDAARYGLDAPSLR